MRIVTFFPLLILAAACRLVPASPDDAGDAQRPLADATASGDTLRLAVGQGGRVPGTVVDVTLIDVPADQRCPVNSLVLCAWAGDASVRLRVVSDTADHTVTLHTGLEPRRAEVDGHVVQLVDLDPANGVEQRPRPEEYRAVVRVYAGAVEPPARHALGDTVRIAVTRSALFDGGALRVTFVAKESESRCPANAMCVQMGDASALVRLEGAGRSVDRSLHTSVEPRGAAHAGYRVRLVNLEPYPGTELPEARVVPVAVVVVTRE